MDQIMSKLLSHVFPEIITPIKKNRLNFRYISNLFLVCFPLMLPE